MVFYIRTRRGWNELIEFAGKVPSPVWVKRDVYIAARSICPEGK